MAKEDRESNDEDLFANQNDNGNLIAGEDEDDNKNVKFKGQLSLTRNGENDREEQINASIKVEAVVSTNKEMKLKIYLNEKIPCKRGREEIQCKTVKVIDGDEGDSIDFKFNENTKCHTSPLPKRLRREEGSVNAQRHIRWNQKSKNDKSISRSVF